MNTHLLLIDPQHDFCGTTGSLSVPGAMEDMSRVAHLIDTQSINHIHVSMDWHQPFDIAHPMWFVDENGENPKPFTQITVADMKSGKWKASKNDLQAYSVRYLEQLRDTNRYTHTIWPEHCLAGTLGSTIVPNVSDSLNNWSRKNGKKINYVLKGHIPTTEHFSAVMAEVRMEDIDEPDVYPDHLFMMSLTSADRILVAGEASSHCVAATVRDLITFNKDNKDFIKSLVILTDCMSPVPHFKKFEDDFFDEMEHLGVTLTQSNKL